MKFFFFHLMPYADLDLNFTEKHKSAWVTLPNSYYDPVKGHALYQRYLDELEYADELGFDGVCVNEHHQTAYGLMPIPAVTAGALARRTRRAKIAVLGRALPLLNNPLVVAEEYAMLDSITGGRLVAGFVRGIGAEYHSSGTNPAESHERFHEAHDLILRAWTEPGPFLFESKHYHFRYVNVWPRPTRSRIRLYGFPRRAAVRRSNGPVTRGESIPTCKLSVLFRRSPNTWECTRKRPRGTVTKPRHSSSVGPCPSMLRTRTNSPGEKPSRTSRVW
jgi:alkanesulfonate monooxygenase SsuD/methylene tetrahydromethanopterin reductase-like flavin-dependent oxidoreductase (luciferase family)